MLTRADVPDHISLWGLRLAICQPLQQYANVRPTRILRGTQSPLRSCSSGDLDWVIVRENSEGEYAGQGGRSHHGFPWEVATETAIFSRVGVERIMRFAFETAAKRPRKLLTVVSKSNAQRNGMVLWDEVAVAVAREFPEVQVDKMLVDAMTTRMVLKPESIDTIVASNLVCSLFLPFPRFPPYILSLANEECLGSMPTSCLTWRLLWPAPSASPRHPTWTRHANIPACSSRFTGRPLTLPAKASRTPWRLSGQPLRCWLGWARSRRGRSSWTAWSGSVDEGFSRGIWGARRRQRM